MHSVVIQNANRHTVRVRLKKEEILYIMYKMIFNCLFISHRPKLSCHVPGFIFQFSWEDSVRMCEWGDVVCSFWQFFLMIWETFIFWCWKLTANSVELEIYCRIFDDKSDLKLNENFRFENLNFSFKNFAPKI